jgi:hypothetical protein
MGHESSVNTLAKDGVTKGNLSERPSTPNDDEALEAPPSGIRAVVDCGLLLLALSHLGFGWGLARTARDLFPDLESCL